MGSKKDAGRARRQWDDRVAPAAQAVLAIRAFLASLALFPGMRNSPATMAAERTVASWQDNHCTIYSVDADLQREVVGTGLPTGVVPGEVFSRLPHHTPLLLLGDPVKITDPDTGAVTTFNMFFVNVAMDRVLDARTGRFLPFPVPLARFVWFGVDSAHPGEFVFTTSSIHLSASVDLQDAFKEVITKVPEGAGELAEVSEQIRGENWEGVNRSLFPVATMLTLYVCSQEPDLVPVRPPTPLTRDRKYKEPGFVMHDLGVRVGSALRFSRRPSHPGSGDTTQRTVAPHVRKAHWHRFWVGPRKGSPSERKLVLRWIPPVAVNVDKGAVAPTVRPVQHRTEEKQ